MRIALLLALLILLTCSSRLDGSRFGAVKSRVREGLMDYSEQATRFNPWDKDEDEETTLADHVLPTIAATGTTLYGTALLLFFRNFPGQIHFLTMMRSNGFHKIEEGIQKAKRNVKDAKWAAIRRAPSFFMATRSMTKLQTRVATAKKRVSMTKQAKADGVVTEKEAKQLKRIEQRQIRNLKRDMRRLARASASLGRVWEALDVDEIKDLCGQFMFQLVAVLATSHNDSKIGKFISRWCLFQNLGGLLQNTNQKLGYPISRLILTRSLTKKHVDRKKTAAIENTARGVMYSTSGYLVTRRIQLAQRLNGAFLSSFIVLRGLRSFVGNFWDRNDDEVTVWSTVGQALEGVPGGVLVVSLVGIGLYCNDLEKKGKLKAPEWIMRPLCAIDNAIHRVATTLDEVV